MHVDYINPISATPYFNCVYACATSISKKNVFFGKQFCARLFHAKLKYLLKETSLQIQHRYVYGQYIYNHKVYRSL